VIRFAGVTGAQFEAARKAELAEIERRRALYLGKWEPVSGKLRRSIPPAPAISMKKGFQIGDALRYELVTE
jgi:hypothetical protein